VTSERARFLPYARQMIDDDDIAAVVKVLGSDWLTTGPSISAFEQALSEVVGSRGAAVCSSGTAALHVSALAIGLGPGDRAVVPSLSFLATANAVRYVGAEVVFADVDPGSGLMGADDLATALNTTQDGSVRAVFPVHLNGQSAEMSAIAGIAREREIMIIEDASHALGTRFIEPDGTAADVGGCRHSDMAVFSFHPAKTIAMGEGGAITSNGTELLARSRRLRNHGMVREPSSFQQRDLAFEEGELNAWYYEMSELGFNYRASDLNCALGLSQLSKLHWFARKRRALATHYDGLLADLAPIVRPLDRVSQCRPAWHLYVVHVNFGSAKKSRAATMRELRGHGIGTQVHYLPLHMQPYYRARYGDQKLPGAEQYYATALSLPLHVNMEEEDVELVVARLAETLGV